VGGPVIVAVAIEFTIVMATLASVLLLLILLLAPGMIGVACRQGETTNFELQAVDHSTDGTNDKLCFAVPIIPSDIHVFM
jgi:hypothetical protein